MINTPDLVRFDNDDRLVTTSLKVAEIFGKKHFHIMRGIQVLECSDNFRESNFGCSTYKDASGKSNPMYHITRDGFTFLAMGFTGKKAAKFKEAYIAAFNKMEKALWERRLNVATRPAPPPSTHYLPSKAITPAQQRLIQNAICDAAYALAQAEGLENWLPRHFEHLYRGLKNRFAVARYDQIRQDRFDEAIAFIREFTEGVSPHVIEHKPLRKPKKGFKAHVNFKIDADLKRRLNIFCATNDITITAFIEKAIEMKLGLENNGPY